MPPFFLRFPFLLLVPFLVWAAVFLSFRASTPEPVLSTAPCSMALSNTACSDPCATEVTPRRVLFLTLEYKAGTFSGNGIYSQSIVRSLAHIGHSVFVISGAPDEEGSKKWSKRTGKTTEFELLEIPVSVWGRLDWKCGWKEFAAGITPSVAAQVAQFRPEWSLVVDWSTLDGFVALEGLGQVWAEAKATLPRMTYLNYRVYTVSEYKGDHAEEEKAFYKEKEREAMARSWAVAALSTRDARFLDADLGAKRLPGAPKTRVLLPPLREDFRQVALSRAKEGPTAAWKQGRKYFSCCVRLSPEKNADLFASLIERLAPFLEEQGIVPLLCGGANSADPYAQSIKDRVAKAYPSTLFVEGFLGPDRMGELYAQTLLNMHPCLYDAYGMTMVEAAAFGVPSVVNVGPGGAVGATELLVPEDGLAFPVDLSAEPINIAEQLMGILKDTDRLAAIAKAASARSLSWSEDANARELTCIAEDS